MANRAGPITSFETLAPPWSLVTLDADINIPVSALNDSSLGYVNGVPVDTGGTNAYSITLPFGSPSGYNSGMAVVFIPNSTNTGGASLAVSPLGSASILNPAGNVLTGGEISQGRICSVVYNANAPAGFRLLGNCPIMNNFGAVTTNQTQNCAGASSVFVSLNITTAVNINLTLTNLSEGTPTQIRFANNSVGTQTFKVIASDPAANAYAVFSVETGTLTQLNTTGRSLVANRTFLIYGQPWLSTTYNMYMIGSAA